MISVGIPSYNEADTIGQLVTKIDEAARQLGEDIVIINADNNSPDDTAKVFKNTKTTAPKVSLVTNEVGKGVNLREIFRWVESHDEITGCILIDGDVTSFETSWLSAYAGELKKGTDYVMPKYGRNYQEGNTTNHFVYPLLGAYLGGKAPRQPISGDFGVSSKYIKHLLRNVQWHRYALTYGIDIFMTLHALYGPFVVSEIVLSRKAHKPSFGKMVSMFQQVAASYYDTRGGLGSIPTRATLLLTDQEAGLFETALIEESALVVREREARDLYDPSATLVPNFKFESLSRVDARTWASVLIAHERLISKKDAFLIASSLTPWYLLRVVTYLRDVHSPVEATREIEDQYRDIYNEWNHEAPTNSTR